MSDLVAEFSLYGEISYKIDECEDEGVDPEVDQIANEIANEIPESMLRDVARKHVRDAVINNLNRRKNGEMKSVQKQGRTRSTKGAAVTQADLQLLEEARERFMKKMVGLPDGTRKQMSQCTIEDHQLVAKALYEQQKQVGESADRHAHLADVMQSRGAEITDDLTAQDVEAYKLTV